MGAWGAGLFSDDTACDIRDEYRDLLGDGLSGPNATDRILEMWRNELDDSDVYPVVWLALASVQVKCGKLEERVKTRALEIIDRGIDLKRWESDPKLYRRRKETLQKIRLQILSPQRPPVRIKKRHRFVTAFKIGDVLAYRLLSGNYAIFRVVEYFTDKGGTYPVIQVCDWKGLNIPPLWRIRLFKTIKDFSLNKINAFMLLPIDKVEIPLDRIHPIGNIQKIRQTRLNRIGVFWTNLDQTLEEHFGIM